VESLGTLGQFWPDISLGIQYTSHLAGVNNDPHLMQISWSSLTPLTKPRPLKEDWLSYG